MVPSSRVISGLQKLQMATKIIKNCWPCRIHLHHCLCVSLSSLCHAFAFICFPWLLLSSSSLPSFLFLQYLNLLFSRRVANAHTDTSLQNGHDGAKGQKPKLCVLRAIISGTMQSAFLDRRKTLAKDWNVK